MKNTQSLRYLLLLFFAFTYSLSISYGQQRWSVGPRVGLNVSNFWGNADNFHYRTGLAAGAFIMYSSVNHFGLSADVLYSQRGARYDGPDYLTGGSLQIKQRVNYLEIPVVARYFLTLSGNFRPNLFIGPSLGLRLNAKRTDAKLNGADAPRYNTQNSADFNSLDLGATAGFQLNFHAGRRQHFLIDGRYTLGLTDVKSGLPNVYGPLSNLRNSTFTLALGYSFGVGAEHPSRYQR